MIDTGIAKLRYVVATRGDFLRRVGLVLVLLGLLGSAVTLGSPPTTTVTDASGSAVIETRTSTAATVDDEYELYRAGETLADEAVYVRGVTPTVTLTATTRAPPDDVAVEQRLMLVYEASSPTAGVFREQRRSLAVANGTVTGAEEVVETTTDLEVAAVDATLAAMREEIGDAGTIAVYLAVETAYDSEQYAGALSDRAPLVVTVDSVRVPRLAATAREGSTVSREEPVAARVFLPVVPLVGTVVVPHLTLAFLALTVLGAAAVAAVWLGRDSVDPERERAWLHRHRYDEWISVGELPAGLSSRTTVVTVESLEALVDVAIDSQTRVIHDRARGWYVVLTAGATYRFGEVQPQLEHDRKPVERPRR